MADRAHDLRMQACHRAADDLRDARDIGIGRLGVGAAETDEAFAFLAKFRGRDRLVKFLGNGRGNRAATDRDAA